MDIPIFMPLTHYTPELAMKIALLVVLTLVLFTVPRDARAQELQIPIDENLRLDMITAELEQELGMFPDAKGFVEARMFQTSDSSYVLEITSLVNERTARTRKPMTRGEMQAFRARVSDRISMRAPQAVMEQDGRSNFITGVTTLSLAYYAWAIPTVLGVDNEESFAGLYMLTGGAGFLVPYLTTKETRVTQGMATLALQGGGRGILDGFMAAELLSGNSEVRDKDLLGAGVLFSLGEMFAGYLLADKYDILAGKASMIGTGGNLGLGLGLGTYFMFANTKDMDIDEDDVATFFASGFLGSAAGYFVGTTFANDANYTTGDARVFSTMALLSAYAAPAILSLTKSDDPKLYVGSSILACTGGALLAHSLLRGRDFTSSQGTFLGLGTIAGGLFSLGAGLLITGADDDNYASTILAMSAVGAMGGFALMFSSFSDRAEAAAKSSSWNIDVNPLGLYSALSKAGGASRHPLPMLQLQYHF
jgi:hypothetical protein